LQRVHLLSGVSWAALFEQKNRWLPKAGAVEGGSENGTAGGVLVVIPADWKPDMDSELLRNLPAGCSVLTTEELIGRYLQRAAGKQPGALNPAPAREDAGGSFAAGILLNKLAAGYLLDSILKDSALDALQEILPGGSAVPQSGYLNIETLRQGYVRALCEYIYDFRQTHHEDLLSVLELLNEGKLSAKEKDLVDIHDEFEQLLEQRCLYDYRRGVAAFLQDHGRDHGPPARLMPETGLVVAGFSRLTSLDRRLLLGLVDRFGRSVILYCSNPRASEATFRVQQPFQAFVQELRDSSADLQEHRVEEPEAKRSCALLPLAELLFHDEKENRPLQASTAVKLVQAENRYREVTSMARRILEIGRQGIGFERIRLVFSDYELYAAILLEVFPRYRIPYRLAGGSPLKLHPLTGIVQSLVAHAVTPNPYPLREKIFSSPYVSFSCLLTSEELTSFAADKDIAIERETIERAVPEPRRFDLDYRWCLEQQHRAARAVKSDEKLEPVRLAARCLEERFAGDREAREREMLKLLISYCVLSRAERSLYVWRSKMTPAAFCRSLQKLIDRFHVAENARVRDGGLNDEVFKAVAARDKLVLKTLEKLRKRLQAHFNLLSGGDQEGGREGERQYPLLHLAGAFTALLSDPELNLPSSGEEGVAVFSSSDVPDSFYPVTFIGGLVDGEFPAKAPFNFLAPRKEGPGGESLLIDRERQNLYQMIAGTTERLFLYFPFSDGGKKLLTSPFVAEIERCLATPDAGERTEKDSLEHARLCFNSREKLIFAARNLDRAYSKTLPVLQELKGISAERFQHIATIFRCDGLRGSPDGLSRFDGIFESSAGNASAAARSIGRQMDNAGFIEVEQLERYAACPLRFLFDDLTHLKPDYQLDYHPDTTERGLLIKKILAGYSEAVTGGGSLPENPEQLLKAIAEQAFSQMPSRDDDLFSGSYKRIVLRGLAETAHAGRGKPEPEGGGAGGRAGSGKRRPGLLSSFLDYEREAPDLIGPYLAALRFGDFKAAGVAVKIAIERVDITSNGEFLIIYTYSIADPGNPGRINKGLRFQAPLMVLALRSYLRKEGSDKQVGGAGVYLVRNPRMIKRGGYFALKRLQASRKTQVSPEKPLFSGQRKYGFLPLKHFEEALEETDRRVGLIDALIRKGRFNPPLCAVKDQTCANCAFPRICRKEQLRLDKIYTAVDGGQFYKPRRKVELAEPEPGLEPVQ